MIKLDLPSLYQTNPSVKEKYPFTLTSVTFCHDLLESASQIHLDYIKYDDRQNIKKGAR